MRQAGEDPSLAIFQAGAALAVMDPIARAPDPVGRLWRRRLALAATVAQARLDGRREGEAEIRDQWLLRGAEEAVGPVGRTLLAWRFLGEGAARQPALWPERLPIWFDLPPATSDLFQAASARPAARALPLHLAAEAAATLLAHGPGHRGAALWLADAVLARALGWDHAVPLLAPHLPRAAFRLSGPAWQAACAAAWAQAALAAIDLHADLQRRAARLQAIAPKLRGRDAGQMVATLLSEDAVLPRAGLRASDRSARRLFDRLTALGVVRELSGRASFRTYGL